MAGSKIPGAYCSVENPVGIDDGTMCRATSPPPGPVCIDSALTTELSDLAFLALNQEAKSYPPPPVTTTLLPELGSLNGRYESSGNPGAIGCDKTGGWSYGTYQLATKRGTFAGFLAFLKTTYPGFKLDDEICQVLVAFESKNAVVDQQGGCGCGLNVNLSGTYRKESVTNGKKEKANLR